MWDAPDVTAGCARAEEPLLPAGAGSPAVAYNCWCKAGFGPDVNASRSLDGEPLLPATAGSPAVGTDCWSTERFRPDVNTVCSLAGEHPIPETGSAAAVNGCCRHQPCCGRIPGGTCTVALPQAEGNKCRPGRGEEDPQGTVQKHHGGQQPGPEKTQSLKERTSPNPQAGGRAGDEVRRGKPRERGNLFLEISKR